jgi:hypothetical protein
MREMEARIMKMTAAAAVIMICAVAIVGVSYAYTASTQNSGNGATSEYVTLTQTGAGAYTFANGIHVYYDTVNTTNATTFQYKLTQNAMYNSPITGATVVKLGETITLHAVGTGNPTELALAFTTEGFDVLASTYKFYLVFNNGTETTIATVSGDDTWTFAGTTITGTGDTYTDVTVNVYYGYEGEAGSATEPPSTVLDGATITFTATHPGNNPGIVLDKKAINVNAGADAQTIAATLISGVTGTITWSSSEVSVATVSTPGDTTTVTFTGVGSTTITASVTSGGIIYTATCLVTVSAAP